MIQPSAKTAIDILSRLQDQTSPAMLAFWVTPNTILTLSGARAYCDGVFYNDDKKILEVWTKEIADSIKALESITEIYFAETKINKTNTKENYAGYDVVMTPGLKYALEQTMLLGTSKHTLLTQNVKDKKLVDVLRSLLKENEQLRHFNKENLNHVAVGILVGYPDKAILGSVTEWEKDDPFAESLIDADIRGSQYYICPKPVYSYPRHLVTDPKINIHEQLWSSILKDYYTSDFHQILEKNSDFQKKVKALGLGR
jgi:hypothetical protein